MDDILYQGLIAAMTNLERRILSLNYSGYFTRTLHEELKDDLDLVLTLRIHADDKFHFYGKPSCQVDSDSIKINDTEKIPKKPLIASIEEVKAQKPKEPRYESAKKGQFYKSYVDIPLWVRKCKDKSHPFFYDYEGKALKCCVPDCEEEALEDNFQGLIRFYTNYNTEDISSIIKSKLPDKWQPTSDKGQALSDRILHLFARQNEPDCFGKHSTDKCQFEKYCDFRSGCSSYARTANNHSKKSRPISPVDPDEVIFQLQEKCRALLGSEYNVPILLLDPDIRYRSNDMTSKILKYRAVDHMEPVSNAEAVLKKIKESQKDIPTEVKKFDAEFKDYYGTKYVTDQSQTINALVNQLLTDGKIKNNEDVRNILKYVVQETTDGTTYDVWETWDSFRWSFGEDDSTPDTHHTLSPIQNLTLEGLLSENPLSVARTFIELLFLKGKGVILTPLDYYGQKMGLIFTYFGTSGDPIENIEDTFKQIALELAPDIFYSLEYEMYDNALRELENRPVSDVPDILLSVFPKFLNMEAGAFWTKEQIKSDKTDIKPMFCRKFEKITDSDKIYTFSPCMKNEASCHSLCPFKKNELELIKKCFKNWGDKPGELFEPFPVVRAIPKNESDTIHNIRCRLLVPVKHEVSANNDTESENKALANIDGVFDLCFDLSEFVIRRYAIDLFREINFVYTLITNAARQKFHILRHATKNAVSAIMGRNMSHNIGSHVLARYSSRVGEDLSKTNKGKSESDHRADFLRYLQRRMDFIAEVATTDKSSWAQSLELKAMLNVLNYDWQNKRITHEAAAHTEDLQYMQVENKSKIHRVPILLEYITGKASLTASVECPDVQDLWFSCPGGEVGVQALYVILENIIRNSARHGNGKGDRVTLTVKVAEADGLIKLTIIDPRTKLEDDGRLQGSLFTAKAASEENAWIKDNAHSDYEEKGTRKKRKVWLCLTNEINSIIRGEPFLDENGNPNPHYWGVREMQICATYLRSIPLGDLQGGTHDPPILTATVEGNKLAYELYLQGAKRCAFVTAEEIKHETEHERDEKSLRAIGFARISAKDKPDGKLAEELQGYEFALIEKNLEDRKKKNPAIWPVRTLPKALDDVNKKIKDLLPSSKDKIDCLMSDLHKDVANCYQNKHISWPKGEISSWVYWEEMPSNANQLPSTGIKHFQKGEKNNCNRPQYDENTLNLAWVDHASGETFKNDFRLFALAGFRNSFSRRLWHFAEIFDSQSLHKPVLESTLANDIHSQAALHELQAAALARVAIIDERIQSSLDVDYKSGLRLGRLWPCMGIWTPDKPGNNICWRENAIQKCNLDSPKIEDVCAFLKSPTAFDNDKKLDFIVIHLTILERLKESDNETVQNTVNRLINKANLAIETPEIVIVTGRGVPSLSQDVGNEELPLRYLPISALMEHLIARPSKLGLIRALWSAAATLER